MWAKDDFFFPTCGEFSARQCSVLSPQKLTFDVKKTLEFSMPCNISSCWKWNSNLGYLCSSHFHHCVSNINLEKERNRWCVDTQANANCLRDNQAFPGWDWDHQEKRNNPVTFGDELCLNLDSESPFSVLALVVFDRLILEPWLMRQFFLHAGKKKNLIKHQCMCVPAVCVLCVSVCLLE